MRVGSLVFASKLLQTRLAAADELMPATTALQSCVFLCSKVYLASLAAKCTGLMVVAPATPGMTPALS
jgi:hypothetical protein